jgi:hypothetical protein
VKKNELVKQNKPNSKRQILNVFFQMENLDLTTKQKYGQGYKRKSVWKEV